MEPCRQGQHGRGSLSWPLHSLLAFLPSPLPLLSRLKEELEQLAVQVPAQAQSKREDGAGPGEAVSLGIRWQGTETAYERSWEGWKARKGSGESSEDSLWGRACPQEHSQGKDTEAGSGGVGGGRSQGGCAYRDAWRPPAQTLISPRPIPSPSDSVKREIQSCPPRRA